MTSESPEDTQPLPLLPTITPGTRLDQILRDSLRALAERGDEQTADISQEILAGRSGIGSLFDSAGFRALDSNTARALGDAWAALTPDQEELLRRRMEEGDS